jgi:hypothetical protein
VNVNLLYKSTLQITNMNSLAWITLPAVLHGAACWVQLTYVQLLLLLLLLYKQCSAETHQQAACLAQCQTEATGT